VDNTNASLIALSLVLLTKQVIIWNTAKFIVKNNSKTHLNNSIDRACLLTEAAVDALCHVDIVARGSPAAICTRLRLNRDSLQQ